MMKAEARIVAGLPGKTSEESDAFYKRAETSPLYEITGYHGIAIESGAEGPYIIYCVNDSLENVVVRLSISESHLLEMVRALNDLVETRIAKS